MKKFLIAVVAIVCAPLIIITALYLISDLKISGISHTTGSGFAAKSLIYGDLQINNVNFHGNKIRLESVSYNNITLKKTVIDNNLNITSYFKGIKLSGRLEKDNTNYKFKGYWQKAPYKKQNLNISYGDKVDIKSDGSLGKIIVRQYLDRVEWSIDQFNLSKIIDLPSSKVYIYGHGFINHDGSGLIQIRDASNTLRSEFDSNSLSIKCYMPKVNNWLDSNITSITSLIKYKNNQLNSDTTINSVNNARAKITSHNKKINIKIHQDSGELEINSKLTLRKDFKLSDLSRYRAIFNALENRFNFLHKNTDISNNSFSKIEFSSKFVANKNPNFKQIPIHGYIKFNLLKPNATIIKIQTENISEVAKNMQFDIDNAILLSSPKLSELNIKGSYNKKPVLIKVNYDQLITAKISAKEIPLPISNNAMLIISPEITITNFGNLNNIVGYVDVNGGYIRSRASNHVVHLPENTKIVGQTEKLKPLELLLKELNGKIVLTTEQPITFDNISGLSGNLWGELTIQLNNHLEPKYTGNITLKNAKYVRNKKIKVAYARAKYEHSIIDNPFLDLKIYREINKPAIELSKNSFIDKNQVVGIIVRGSVSQPQINPYSNNSKLSKLQIIAALETGTTDGITPEQGMLSLISLFNDDNKSKSPIESIKETLDLDEIYFTSNQDYNHDLINPNLGGGSIVLSKIFFNKIKTSYIASLHNSDYLLLADYPLTDQSNLQIYSSRYTNPQITRPNESYGFNALWYKSIK